MRMKKICQAVGLAFIVAILQVMPLSAETVVNVQPPEIFASAFILYEPDRDMILYAKNEERRIYPASMTKILTALVAEEYIAPEEILIVGNEIYNIPNDSSRANHVSGEALTGVNLLRGLMIPSGNETACIAAMHIARAVSGNPSIAYRDAERVFCGLLNEKAEALGAKDTHFTNPHGYHNETHYTTAYDLALITKAALDSDLIMQIAGETEYFGPSAETDDTSLKITNHEWKAHNELIKPGVYNYPYATGMKTGFTDEAGECLAATAEKDGRRLIAILCNVPENMRWQDAMRLFEYGFNAFAERTLQSTGDLLGEVAVSDPRLGDETVLTYHATEDFAAYLNGEQLGEVVRDITLDKLRLAPPLVDEETGETDNSPRIVAPVTKDEIIGSVAYSYMGEILYRGDISAGRDVEPRTFNTDMDYYLARAKAAAFSTAAIPFWIAGILLPTAIVILIVTLVRRHKRRNSGRYRFNMRR